MPKGEINARIQQGWVMAGRQAVNLKAQGIVTAGEALATATGLVDMDVWVLPEPMMPQGQVLKVLYDLFKQKMGDASTLNTIATALVGLNIGDLVARMDASISAANQAGKGPEAMNEA